MCIIYMMTYYNLHNIVAYAYNYMIVHVDDPILFFFCFCYLILRGDPLSQRLFFWGPTESLQVHTQTYSYTQHNYYKQSQTIKAYYLYTHTVWSVAGLFFQLSHSGVQGWV